MAKKTVSTVRTKLSKSFGEATRILEASEQVASVKIEVKEYASGAGFGAKVGDCLIAYGLSREAAEMVCQEFRLAAAAAEDELRGLAKDLLSRLHEDVGTEPESVGDESVAQ